MNSEKNEMNNKKREMTFTKALIPIIFLIVSLVITIQGSDGDAHMPILATAIVAAIIALSSGYTWQELEDGIIDTFFSSLSSMLIFCIIGVVIGTWILGGIVPSMIFYGLKMISPKVFLVTACIISALIALATGSSWSTLGTVGIALMGIGHGLGIPGSITAGALVSGAYFGDKMSPLSDTTNLAPAVSGTNVFEHIKYMIYTTTPALIISLILYGIIGLRYSSTTVDTGALNVILDGMQSQFTISPILLLPPFFIVFMVVKKISAIPGLIMTSLLGILCAVIFQGSGVGEVINAAQYGYASDSGVAVIDELLTGGGLQSMMWPLSLVLISVSMAGIMRVSGMIEILAKKILSFAKKQGGLILATVLTAIGVNLTTGDQYLAIIFTGTMYKDEYNKQSLDPRVLSRTLEDAGTMTSPLIPWGACGVFVAATLGVSTFAYVPFAFLNLLTPIIAVIYGYTGWFVDKIDDSSVETADAITADTI